MPDQPRRKVYRTKHAPHAPRTFIGRHAGVMSLVSIAFLTFAVLKLLISDPQTDPIPQIPEAGHALYFDLATGQLSREPDLLPGSAHIGTALKSGKARAYVFACNDCRTQAERKTLYLELFTSDAVRRLSEAGITTYTQLAQEPPAGIAQIIGPATRFIRAPQQPQWVSYDSSDAQWVLAAPAQMKCSSGKQPIACLE